MQLEPLASDGFEGVLRLRNRYELLSFALFARIDASGDLLPRGIEALTRFLQSDIGIHTERNALLFVRDSILVSPQTSTGGRDLDIETATIEKLEGFRSRLRRLDSCAR
jgi:hypothetical protein